MYGCPCTLSFVLAGLWQFWTNRRKWTLADLWRVAVHVLGLKLAGICAFWGGSTLELNICGLCFVVKSTCVSAFDLVLLNDGFWRIRFYQSLFLIISLSSVDLNQDYLLGMKILDINQKHDTVALVSIVLQREQLQMKTMNKSSYDCNHLAKKWNKHTSKLQTYKISLLCVYVGITIF